MQSSARSFLSVGAALVLSTLLLSSTVSGAGTITYRNCTDRALCLSGCQEAVVPQDQCFGTNGVIESELIRCIPTIRVCGDLSYFTDPLCTNLLFTDGFVCDECNPNRVDGAEYNKVVCSRGTDGLEFLALNACGANSTCKDCNNYQNVTAGACIPIAQQSLEWKQTIGRTSFGRNSLAGSQTALYAKYTGATTCTGVSMQQWKYSTQCASSPTLSPMVPENSCIDGATIHCNW